MSLRVQIESFNPFGYYGPWGRIDTPVIYGWRIQADELPEGGWGVHCWHDSGSEPIPLGPNIHKYPWPEIRRLAAMLEITALVPQEHQS